MMPTVASSKLPAPDSWEEFEQIIHDIVQREWGDPTAIRNGRQGQSQDGVDISCTPERFDGEQCGIQCKNTDNIDINSIEEEVDKAEDFQPALDRFIIITSSPSDSNVREDVQKLSEARTENEKFLVDVLFWEDVVSQLSNHEDLLQKHYPQFFSDTSSSYCSIYTADEAGIQKTVNQIRDQAGCDTNIPFIERDKISDIASHTKIHLTGPKGSGKSRTLIELASEKGYSDNIHHVVIPERGVNQVEDLSPALQQRYTGDVLLLWDDIHRINPAFQNDVFRDAVLKLQQEIEQQGFELHVISTSRSEANDSIIEYEDIESPLWSQFNILDLSTPPKDVLEEILDATFETYAIPLEGERRTDLLRQIYQNDPSPLYIVSLAQLWDELPEVKTQEIKNLPQTTEKFWTNNYEKLKDRNDPGRFVLWSASILAEVDLPILQNLIRGLCIEIFNRPWHEVRDQIEALQEKGWIGNIYEIDEESLLAIHDVKLEAVPDGIEPCVEEVSHFLESQLEEYIEIDDPRFISYLLGRFALQLHIEFRGEYDDIAREQFETAVTMSEVDRRTVYRYSEFLTCHGELEDAMLCYEILLAGNHPNLIHIQYGNLLRRMEEYEAAEEMYQKAIEMDDSDIRALVNYSMLLTETERMQESWEYMLKAVGEIPERDIDHWLLANTNYNLGRFFRAHEHFEHLRHSSGHWTHNTSIVQLRSLVEAKTDRMRSELETRREESDSLDYLREKIEETIFAVRAMANDDTVGVSDSLFIRATTYACEGNKEQALEDLKLALEYDHSKGYNALSSPFFIEMRNDDFFNLIERTLGRATRYSESD
jgi:tetratricopeptide (TPR) repeat protein